MPDQPPMVCADSSPLLFVPGIPQIYYVGLLAGRNAPEAARSGDPREINRRAYSEAEVLEPLHQPVVQALIRLIRFRTAHPAFGGAFTLFEAPAGELRMAWHTDAARAELWTRLADATYRLTVTTGGMTQTVTDVAALTT